VLTYYAITNAAALRLGADERHWPRALAVAGLAGCLTLIVTLPWQAIVTGAVALLIGVAVRRATSGSGHGSVEGSVDQSIDRSTPGPGRLPRGHR
jgi:APA family basic amino acid/polyamine antiporter